ncbi:sel1 repeat family protein, partial [Escherichia coli]|nr:sel1 repeat family protein [Escherichia coli]
KFIHTWLRFGEIMRGSLRAKYWFEKAATQNLPIAQITLGQIYAWGLDGNGINKEEALLWLNKAKAQGQFTDKQINAIISKKID